MGSRRHNPEEAALPPDKEEVEEGMVGTDLSGWPPHTSERRDFWHRLRTIPKEVVAWRRRMFQHVQEEPRRFPAAAKIDPRTVQELLDTGISFLRELARILAVLYGTRDLGNRQEPTDELVYIILSRKTPERAYQQAFESLKLQRPWGHRPG
jgi:hypothetical protein